MIGNDTSSNSPRRILITGASSFSGQHLAAQLLEQGNHAVFGVSRSESSLLPWKGYFRGDITDSKFINDVVKTVHPTDVLHLAAATDSKNINDMFQVNLAGTWNVLHACSLLHEPVKALLVGSAASFGDMKVKESVLPPNRLAVPNSLYGWVKEKSFELPALLPKTNVVEVKMCRTFNLIGPGLPLKYAAAAIIERMLSRSSSSIEPFIVHDGNAIRDFVDVRDATRAWIGILDQGSPLLPYSVGRGIPVTIQQLCLAIRDELGLSFPIQPENTPLQSSRSRIHKSIADTAALTRDLNWTPRISFEQSVRDMLQHAKLHRLPN
jgi:nucleoside-diphosphate-sugar epimerase